MEKYGREAIDAMLQEIRDEHKNDEPKEVTPEQLAEVLSELSVNFQKLSEDLFKE